MMKKDMKCKKCGVPIVVEMSCFYGRGFDEKQLEEKLKNKELNYIVAGEAGSSIKGIKRKCVKCGTEFTV